MFGLHGGELLVVLLTTFLMPLLTLLAVVFIIYRFWHWLKRRDEDKRAAARTRFPVDAAEDLNSRTLWETGAQSGKDSVASADATAASAGVADVDSATDASTSAQPAGPESSASPATSASSALLSRIASRGLDEALTARGLSERERTVLRGVCTDKTFAVLAEELGVSRSTVGTYCTRAYEKLGVSSKEDAKSELAHLTRHGLLAAVGLSEREAEIAVLVADGASTSDVAAALVLSEATVSSHLQQAYVKLGVHSRAELAELLQDI